MPTRLAPGTFYGRSLGKVEAAGLTFAESVYAPGLEIPPHAHANAFFYFVVEGDFEESYRQGTRTGGPSTLVFHPAGEPHANRWRSPGGRVFHVEISPARAAAVRGHAPILDAPADFRGGRHPG